MAQFDDISLEEAYGWWPFSREDFEGLEEGDIAEEPDERTEPTNIVVQVVGDTVAEDLEQPGLATSQPSRWPAGGGGGQGSPGAGGGPESPGAAPADLSDIEREMLRAGRYAGERAPHMAWDRKTRALAEDGQTIQGQWQAPTRPVTKAARTGRISSSKPSYQEAPRVFAPSGSGPHENLDDPIDLPQQGSAMFQLSASIQNVDRRLVQAIPILIALRDLFRVLVWSICGGVGFAFLIIIYQFLRGWFGR